jgi:hypothetical protein
MDQCQSPLIIQNHTNDIVMPSLGLYSKPQLTSKTPPLNGMVSSIPESAKGDPIKIGDYVVDSDIIKGIVREAKANGIDPYEALSIAYQESHIDKDNPYHLNPDYYPSNYAGPKLGVQSIVKQLTWGKALQKKGTIPDTDEFRLQGYNGYGKIKRGHADLNGSTSIYGQRIPVEGIDFKKNPLYGKRIIDIRDNIIKKNKDIQSFIDQETNSPPLLNGTSPLPARDTLSKWSALSPIINH